MRATKFRLKFSAPLHIAARGVGYERSGWIVHSDTLYSAILTVWSRIFPGDIKGITEANPPPFLLSTAFPYSEEQEFYPMPLAPVNVKIQADDGKKFRRVQFVETALLQKIVTGERLTFDPADTRQGGRFWVQAQQQPLDSTGGGKAGGAGNGSAGRKNLPEEPVVFQTEVPRVTIDRVASKAMNYFVSEVRFAEGAGLFFWARFTDPECKSRFIQVLRVLGDEGLGLDRTSGKGFFEVEDTDIADAALPGLPNSRRFMTLALYHPVQTEMSEERLRSSGYELVRRGGYISGLTFRRQTITMFAEGSVFPGSPQESYGAKCHALDPDFALATVGHPVYRYGYAFPIGIQ